MTAARGAVSDGRSCWLYRFFNSGDELLYVGVTIRLDRRLSEHRRADRWGAVVRVTTELFPSAVDAREAELVAIRTERPRWNVVGVPRPARPVAARGMVDALEALVNAAALAGASDLSKATAEQLFAGIRESELVYDSAQEWTGRLVAEARRRGIPWSQLTGETKVPKATLDRRAERAP